MKTIGQGFQLSARRRRGVQRCAAAIVLFVLVVLAVVPVANAADAGAPGFPLPRLGTLFGGRALNFGSLPKQTSGSADGKSHTATADSTRAGAGSGNGIGKGNGELQPAAGPKGRKIAAGASAKGTTGFDPKTSKENTAKRTKTSRTYDNADGTFTVDYFADQVNYTAPDGTLQPIDPTLVRTGTPAASTTMPVTPPTSPAATASSTATPSATPSVAPSASPTSAATPSSTVASSAAPSTAASSTATSAPSASGASPAAVSSTASSTRLVRKAADTTVSFATSGADPNLMTDGDGTASVSFGLSGAADVAATTSGAQATYSSIQPNVDLKLLANNSGVKQTLVLNSASAPTTFTFPYTITGDLTPTVTARGVEFVDASGKNGILIPNAVMTDSKQVPGYGSGAQSNAITYALSITADGKPALQMTLDSAWLHDPARQFPVVVDPTVGPFQSNDSATMDTSNSPMGTYSGDLKIGTYDGTHDGAAFVQFSGVSQFQNTKITAAQVNLWHTYSSSCAVAEPIKLMQITNTWNIGSITSYPGVAYNGTLLGSLNVIGGANCGASEWDYVPLNAAGLAVMQGWAQGTTTNYGFLVSSETSDANGWKRFNSNAEGGNVIPSMNVTYSQDVAPQIDSMYPNNNSTVGTLTPELLATGHDPDQFPNPSVQYDFQVANSAGTKIADSGLIASGDWTVPAGILSWNQAYSWTVQTYDGYSYSNYTTNAFATQVPQPPITSGLSQNTSGHGFDATIGNYTTSATDAQVAGVGPMLQVVRDYNSLDPRAAGAFGAAWSSVFDARAAEQYNPDNSVASVNFTYPDGSETGYGRKADGSFTSPGGHYAVVKQITGGYTLTDKNDTVYSFTQNLNNGVYGISSVADAAGRTVSFAWAGGQITTMTSGATGRALHLTWATPSGATAAHVATVATDPATAGNTATALTWTYAYSGDQLSSVCSPVDTAPGCIRYSYASGSPFPSTVLNSAPVSYWRLNEQAGTAAASSVLLNEGNDNQTYNGVTLGQGAALTGSGATSVTLAGGAGSYIATNSENLSAAGGYASIGAWFKTTSSGIIAYYGDQPMSNINSTGINTPALYVGWDGKLHGCFATGNCANTQVTSAGAVTDGAWHYALLSGAGGTQTLYLDGVSQGKATGQIQSWKQPYITIGSGMGGNGWPYLNTGIDGFIGSLSDVAVWNKPLSQTQATALYAAGKRATSLLTSITKPSGGSEATVAYNPANGRVQTVSDAVGGTWTVQAPVVSGSSQVYRSAVMAGSPSGYWRLGDAAGAANAADEVASDGQNAVYSNVTLGSGGVFGDATSASFNGTSSYLQLPSYATPYQSSASISMWFKTTTATGMLFDYQSMPVGGTVTSGTMNMDAYVGSDGNVYAGFDTAGGYPQLSSKKVVTDGKWHQLVLAGGGSSQTLYLDGQLVNTTTGATSQPIIPGSQPYVYVGAGTTGSGWAQMPNLTNVYFNGQISDFAFYQNQVSSANVTAMWSAYQKADPVLPGLSALVPATTAKTLVPTAVSAKMAFDGTSYAASAAQSWNLSGAKLTFQADGNLVIHRNDTGAAIWASGTNGNPGAVLSFQTDGNLVIYSDSTKSKAIWASGTNVPPNSGNYATFTPDGAFTIFKADNTPLWTFASPVVSAAGVISDVTDPNAGARMLAVTDATGAVTSYGYDTGGFLNTLTNPDGDTTTTGHDLRGNLVSKTTCQVQSTNTCATAYYTYWPDDVTAQPVPDPRNDLLTSYRDPRSANSSDNTYLTSYTYDSFGDQTSVTTPPVAGFPNGRRETTAYTSSTTAAVDSGTTPAGLPSKATTAGGKNTVTGYLHDGDIASTTDAAGLVTKYTYDNLGRVLTKSEVSDTYNNNGAGLVTSYAYDGLDRITSQTDPATTDKVTGAIHTAVTTTVFDANGNITSKKVTDSTGGDAARTTSSTYNNHDQAVTSTDAAGAVTSYGYDAFGNRTKVVDPNGTETDYAFDADSRQLTSTLIGYTGDPANPSTAKNLVTDSKAYDPAGRLASETDSMGYTTAYTYTDDGLTAKVTRTDASGANPFLEQANTYDAAGNLTSRTTNNGATVTNYTVDAASRVTSQTQDPSGVDRTTTVTYNPDDAVAAVNLRDSSSWNRTTTYGFDAAGRQNSQTVHQISTSTAPASASGQVGAWNLADGNVTTAADASGNGNTGTLAGGASWSTDHGGSVVLDGASGTITSTTSAVNTAGSFTVSAWVKVNANGTTNYEAVSQAGGTATGFDLGYHGSTWMCGTGGTWWFWLPAADAANTAGTCVSSAAGSVTAGAWTHLAGTFDATSKTMTLYVNGVSAGTATEAATPWNATGPLLIGKMKYNGGDYDYLPGKVSGVRTYSRALTSTEVANLYSGTPDKQTQSGLTGQWNLTDGNVAAAADFSGNNNTATLSGGASWSADHNGSLALDGTSGHALVGKPVVDTGKSFTVASWVKLNAVSTSANQTFLSVGGSSYAGFYLEYNGGANAFEFNRPNASASPASWYPAVSTTTPVAGTWYHVAAVVDASTGIAKIYVNGTLQGTAPTDPTPWTASGSLLMGDGYCNGDCNWTNGKIAGVQAYSRALSATEVASLYAGNSILPSETTVTTSSTLDERGLPTSSTDANGNVTTYVYDEAGRKAAITVPAVNVETGGNTPVSAHPVTSVGYDTFGETAETEDANGNVTTTAFDADGRATSLTRPNYTAPGTTSAITAVTSRTYDKNGNPLTVTDALGNKTSYTYDQRNLAATVTTPGGGVTHTVYDTNGEALSTTDGNGAVNQATWDYLGRKATSTVLERYPAAATYTTGYTYGANGWLSQTTSPAGVITTDGYDGLGELTSTRDGAGNATRYAYDFMGDPQRTTYADGTYASKSYDALSRVVGTQQYDSSGTLLTQTTNVWDANSNLVSATDARGTTTNYTYDGANRLTSEVQPVTGTTSITTGFGYDAAGNRTRYTDGNGSKWITTYNTWNLPESAVEPSTAAYTTAATSTFTTAYDADGHAVAQSAPGGVTVSAAYDADGNLTGQSGTGAEAATAARTFGYDKTGRITSASSAAAGSQAATSESFTYNDRSELLTSTGAAGASSFTYTGDGSMASRTDASGTTGYAYDSAGRLSTINDGASGNALTYSYNTLNQVSQINYGSSSDVRTFGYDTLHRPTSDTLKTAGGSTVASIGYGWDADSNLTSKTTTGFATSATNTYTYDIANRLTSWNNGTATVAYGYDNNGNRTSAGSATYTYDARDELTSDGTTTYAYTARGTQTTGTAGVAQIFDAFGQDVTAGTQNYTYDALGRAITAATTSGASQTLSYSGIANLAASDGANTYSRDPNGQVVGIGTTGQSAGSGIVALTDIHSDVVGDFTAAGTTLTGSAAYDPLGKPLGADTVTGSLGYQSEFTDKTTGNVNMAARWYNPATGQFTSRDTQANSPVPNSVAANPFAYGNDDPLTKMDPSGHRPLESNDTTYSWDTTPAALAEAADVDSKRSNSAITHTLQKWATSKTYAQTMTNRYVYNRAIAVRDAYRRAQAAAEADDEYRKRTPQALTRTFHKWATDPVYQRAQTRQYLAERAYAQAYGQHLAQVTAARASAAKHKSAWGSFTSALRVGWVGVDNAFGHALFGTLEQLDPVTGGEGWLHQQENNWIAADEKAIHKADEQRWANDASNVTSIAMLLTGANGVRKLGMDVVGGFADGWSSGSAAAKAGASTGEASGSARVIGQACSFSAATGVLMADGTSRPIGQMKIGDRVANALPGDTAPGQHTVSAVHVSYDTDLLDLTIATPTGAKAVHTTGNHRFYDATTGTWLAAASLRVGDSLDTPGEGRAKILAAHRYAGGRWMYNLTIDGIHTYYVEAGNTPVLVHNTCDGFEAASEAAFTAAEDPASIFVKNKHMSFFEGNYAKFATADFAEAQSWVAEALTSDVAVFKPNGLDGTFKLETDLGRTVGTKGQTGIRAIVTYDGRVINAFPFNPSSG